MPDVWIEQTTYRLQGGCSTAELIRLAAKAGIEPATNRLTVCCTTAVLSRNNFGEGSWWGWLESNQLNVEVTDLQSAVPHQLHRIPVAGMDQYRQLLDDVDVDEFELVCAAGLEPATSSFQSPCATTALRTEVVGGTLSAVFIMARSVSQLLAASVSRCGIPQNR